jgi:hypothetical protein
MPLSIFFKKNKKEEVKQLSEEQEKRFKYYEAEVRKIYAQVNQVLSKQKNRNLVRVTPIEQSLEDIRKQILTSVSVQFEPVSYDSEAADKEDEEERDIHFDKIEVIMSSLKKALENNKNLVINDRSNFLIVKFKK